MRIFASIFQKGSRTFLCFSQKVRAFKFGYYEKNESFMDGVPSTDGVASADGVPSADGMPSEISDVVPSTDGMPSEDGMPSAA